MDILGHILSQHESESTACAVQVLLDSGLGYNEDPGDLGDRLVIEGEHDNRRSLHGRELGDRPVKVDVRLGGGPGAGSASTDLRLASRLRGGLPAEWQPGAPTHPVAPVT